MNSKKLFALLLALVLALGLMSGCGEKAPAEAPAENPAEAPSEEAPAEEAAPEEGSVRLITDMLGREIEVPAEIKSIAAGFATARILTYAGCADRVTGISENEIEISPNRPYIYVNGEQFKDLSVIGAGTEFFDEALVLLDPDIVLVANMPLEDVDKLQDKLGIPVVSLVYGSLNGVFDQGVYDSIMFAAELCGTQEHGAAVVEAIKGYEKDLNERTRDIPEEERARVYTGTVSFRGPHGIDGTCANYPPFSSINAINVADETGEKGTFIVDKEQILVWDPEYIFFTPTSLYLVAEDYKTDPSFYDGLSAFKNGNIYSQVSYNSFGTNIEIAIVDAYYAGTVLYPECFEDLDFEAKADEIFEALLGQPYLQVLKDNNNSFGKIEVSEITGA